MGRLKKDSFYVKSIEKYIEIKNSSTNSDGVQATKIGTILPTGY